MSIQLKKVYLATNLESLNFRALNNKQSLIAKESPKSLFKIAQTLFEEALKAEGWERDEEKAYIIFLRYLSTVIQVKKTSLNVSPSEKKYCDEILEQNRSKISEATGHVERLKKSLKTRYDIINATSSSSTNNAPNSTASCQDTSSRTSSFTSAIKKTPLENTSSFTPSFDRNLKPSRRNSVPEADQQQQEDGSHVSSEKSISACVWCETPFQSDSSSFLSSDGQDIICGSCYNCTMGHFGSSQIINFNIHNSNVTVVENGAAAASSASNSPGSVPDTSSWCTFFADSFTNHCNIGSRDGDNCSELRAKEFGNDFGKHQLSTPSAALELAGIDFTPPKESSTTSDCVICQDRESECCFIPCGHQSVCFLCSEEYKKTKSQREGLVCPICRQQSTGIFKIYKV